MECTVRINNIDYVLKIIKWNDERLRMPDGDFHFGVTNMKEKEIYIANNLPEQTLENTLRHEIIHAYIDAYGMLQVEWNDEIIADFIAAHFKNIIITLEIITNKIMEEKKAI